MKVSQALPARQAISFALCSVAAGFPSPVDDLLDMPLDFNDLLIAHPEATFAVRVAGGSMIGAGLFPGHIAVVDRAVTGRLASHISRALRVDFWRITIMPRLSRPMTWNVFLPRSCQSSSRSLSE
jgi:hypothetical protein